MNFPDWSDLSSKSADPMVRDEWDAELSRLMRYEHYYSGTVFQEYLEKDAPTDPDIPLFPAGINLCKNFCHVLTDSMFGDWSERPIQFGTTGEDGAEAVDQRAIALIDAILDECGFWPQLWEGELDRNKYGGCVFRVSVDPELDHHIRWSRVYRDAFFPVWDPERKDEFLETTTMTRMSPTQVRIAFPGIDVDKDVNYVEKWTLTEHKTWLGDRPLKDGPNPYGTIPFVYIPRLRTELWWGDSLIEDVIPLQDELNMRIADIGDVSAANAHPTLWGVNLPRGFDRSNFPRGSNQMWDLGRTVGEYKPEVGVLEPKNTVMPAVFEQVKLLLKFAREAAQTPAIAYGDDDGGGQRSGDTLEIRMRSLLSAVMRSRMYMTAGMRRMLRITAAILKQKAYTTGAYADIGMRTYDRLERLVPSYAEVLPRRQPELVDEVVKLLSTDPPAISLETAVKLLGHNVREVQRIKDMIGDEDLRRQSPAAKPIDIVESEKQKAMQPKEAE